MAAYNNVRDTYAKTDVQACQKHANTPIPDDRRYSSTFDCKIHRDKGGGGAEGEAVDSGAGKWYDEPDHGKSEITEANREYSPRVAEDHTSVKCSDLLSLVEELKHKVSAVESSVEIILERLEFLRSMYQVDLTGLVDELGEALATNISPVVAYDRLQTSGRESIEASLKTKDHSKSAHSHTSKSKSSSIKHKSPG